MRLRTLTELANNPDLISGIYNYCDRWCERCPLTSRCLVYATEQEDNDSPESRDIRNEVILAKTQCDFPGDARDDRRLGPECRSRLQRVC